MAKVTTIVALSMLLLPAAAMAQLKPEAPLGSRQLENPDVVDQTTVRIMQKKFAQCVYYRREELALRFLTSGDPFTLDYDALGMKHDDLNPRYGLDQCLSRAMRAGQSETSLVIRPTLMRTLLAEEVYLDSNPTPLALPAGSSEVLATRVFPASGGTDRARSVAAFADCIAYHGTIEGDTLLRTDPASPEEGEAIRALVPILSNCIVAGEEISFTATSIRAMVAEGLWARSHYGAALAVGQAQ